MNFSLPTGILFGGGLIYWLITSEVSNPMIFANPHSIGIVLGGTIAAALICFPFEHFFNIFHVLIRALLGKQHKEIINVINEIVEISEFSNDGGELTSKIESVKNPFFKECIELLVDNSLTVDELEEVLEKRVELQNERYRQENATFRIIGKFPPAFGLIGATLGMIALLQGLGAPDAFKSLGPAMSVALTATFWGLLLANLVLVPMGENLHLASQNDLIQRRAIAEGTMLIHDKKHPLVVEEFLKSYLTPKMRNKMKEIKVS